MRIEDFVGRLQKAAKDGHGWKACCPAHDDHNPSLSVSAGTDGKILVKCWAGCHTDAVLAAMGLKMSDLMGEKREEAPVPGKGKREKGRIVAEYDYTDADGKVLFQVCRMDPKAFTQRVPDGGGWKWGRARYGVPEVLYRLPKVLAAAAAGKAIIVCEGEKDVQAWESLGVVATCNPGGAGKWRREFSACFRGAARVLVIADNDPEPWPGQRHADDVRRMLELDGVPVSVMMLPAVDGVEVKDSADWIAAGGTRAALGEAIKGAPPWPPHYLGSNQVGVLPHSQTSATGEGRPAGVSRIAAGIKIDMRAPLARNIANNLYEASKDADGKTRNLGTAERREVIAQTVLQWLRQRGRFFSHAELKGHAQSMFFDASTNELMLIESDRFQSWIALESGQNRTNRDYAYFHAAVHDEALCGENSRAIVPECFWARRGDAIYLSNGDGSAVKVTAQGCQAVANGTDDVLFQVGRTLTPWALLPEGQETDPFDTCRLFRDAAYVSPHGRMLVRLWLLGLAAGHKCKPPLVFAGGVGSGKTRSAVGLFELLGMIPRVSSVAENGEENFWTSLDQGGLVCFDNADTRIKWLPDAMAAASTDGTHEKRRMYSDSDLIQQRAKAWAVVTSANATFAADAGLADRLIVVRLDRRVKDTAESALTTEIAAARDGAISWIARVLGRALADTSATPQSLNRRHPDWAAFAVRCGRAIKAEAAVVEALQVAETDKSRFSVENDQVGLMLLQIMAARDRFDGPTGTLIELMESEIDGFDKHLWSPSKVGKRIEKLWPHVEAVFRASKRLLQGKTHYSMVGVVGVEGHFDTSCSKTISQGLYQNTLQPPPTPPNDSLDPWQPDPDEFVLDEGKE
jgi:hypothetical protein